MALLGVLPVLSGRDDHQRLGVIDSSIIDHQHQPRFVFEARHERSSFEKLDSVFRGPRALQLTKRETSEEDICRSKILKHDNELEFNSTKRLEGSLMELQKIMLAY